MNEIIKEINEDEAVQTPEEKAALLDRRINANAQIAAESIVAVGRDLKVMRDEKLYIKLGCQTFSEYCETKTQIKQRQAYNFIKCYETYGEQLTSIQHLGITKLAAMTALDSEERNELIESGEASNLSSRELEKRIEELQNKCEQLTMQLEEAENKSDEEAASETEIELIQKNEELFQKNEELVKELEALKSINDRLEETSDSEKEKLKNEVELLKKQNEDLSQAFEKESSEKQKKIEEDAAKKQRETEKKHAEEIKKLKDQIAEAEKKAALQANAKKQAPPDSQKEKVKFHCEECLRSFNSAIAALESVEDEDAKKKCKQAIKTIVQKMEDIIK